MFDKKNIDEVTPYNVDEEKDVQVKKMFDEIAVNYDKLNGIMSLCLDKNWRKKTIAELVKSNPKDILDMACGTGDMVFMMNDFLTGCNIVGADFSAGMLKVADQRKKMIDIKNEVSFCQEDGLNLSFMPESFDAVSIAFGLRNFVSIEKGISQFFRVLKKGGVLYILELSVPRNKFVRFFYNIYTRIFIPFIGGIVSKNARAYSYLPDSIAAFPDSIQMCLKLNDAGFDSIKIKFFMLGVCTLYIAEKSYE